MDVDSPGRSVNSCVRCLCALTLFGLGFRVEAAPQNQRSYASVSGAEGEGPLRQHSGHTRSLGGRPSLARRGTFAQTDGKEASQAPSQKEEEAEEKAAPDQEQPKDLDGEEDLEGRAPSPSPLMDSFPDSPYRLGRDPKRPRSDFFAPFFSFVFPGLDQWLEGQTTSALAYTGLAVTSLAYSADVYRRDHVADHQLRLRREAEARGTGENEEKARIIDQRDVAYRKYTLGMLLYQGAAGFSSYHSFRSAVRSRQHRGQYQFLTTEETPMDLLKAPFRFSYLTRGSTYVPLAIGLGLAGLRLVSEPPEGYAKDRLKGSDVFFTGAYSMNAGTHEEAFFRGWLMPFAAEYTGSPFWANVGQALLFAAAHLNTNATPIPQLLLGYHLGNVVQEDNWRLGEAIFIHVWWDVLAFASTYSYKEISKSSQALAAVPVFWLPPLELAF